MAKKKYDIVEPMTIDDLARMMANGFNELKEDLRNEFLPRFDILELKIDACRQDINTLYFNDGKLRGRVEKLENRVLGSVQEA